MRKELLLVLLGVSIGANAVFGESAGPYRADWFGSESPTVGLYSTGTTKAGRGEAEAFCFRTNT